MHLLNRILFGFRDCVNNHHRPSLCQRFAVFLAHRHKEVLLVKRIGLGSALLKLSSLAKVLVRIKLIDQGIIVFHEQGVDVLVVLLALHLSIQHLLVVLNVVIHRPQRDE